MRSIPVAASVALAAVVVAVLALHGTEEAGLRAVIRATARTSAICVAAAFARVRSRDFLTVLPVSHAIHYAAILALAATTTPENAHISSTSIGGLAILGLMIFAALRPATWTLYALWIIFVIGFIVRDMSQPVYPAIMLMLAASAVLRFATASPRPVEH
jgi:hypothetical protein